MSIISLKDKNNITKSVRKGPYRVMVVDDSAVIRGFISRWLSEDPSIKVVGTASNGEMALTVMPRYDPEIIILDVNMPIMDGLSALPKFFEINPKVKVVMASTLTTRNAEISMRALSMGASDYIAKPESTRDVASSKNFQKEIISKVISIAAANRQRNGDVAYKGAPSITDEQFKSTGQSSKNVTIRPFPRGKSAVLAIGSSTGGPQALLAVLKDLKAVDVPIVITQHMPETFTKILAKHLTGATNFDCKEAEEGDVLEKGKVYIAPGDYHMKIVEKEGNKIISLNKNPQENFCRPSVEPMLRSLIDVYGAEVFAVILTGMGHDGLEACRTLVERGGKLIAQDQVTSVVWGMPGAVAQAGLCSGVYPLDQIATKIKEKLMGLM